MTDKELQERLAVRAEARTWLGTRYRNRMAVRGEGIDCAHLPLHSFIGAGLPCDYEVERYSSDWHLHRDEERYLSVVARYMWVEGADQRTLSERWGEFKPNTSDLLMWKVGLTFSHSALVTEWPYVIHASLPDRMVIEVDVRGTVLMTLPMLRCSYWGADN